MKEKDKRYKGEDWWIRCRNIHSISDTSLEQNLMILMRCYYEKTNEDE